MWRPSYWFPSTPAAPPLSAPDAAGPGKPDDKPKEEKFEGFDPRGLERAAKAAKELEANPLAKDAIALTKEVEKTAQLNAQATIEENKAKQQAFAVERQRVAEEERRKTIETEHRAGQQSAQYQDQLSRKRNQDQMQAQAAMRAQELKRQEESNLKMEQARRETAAYEAQLRKDAEVARAEAKARARALQERANFDLTLERTRVEAKEFRETVREGIQESGRILGDGLRAFGGDWSRIGTTIGAFSLLALGVYSARVGTGVAGRFVEARLGKPPLVRDTSRSTPMRALLHPWATMRQAVARRTASHKTALDGVVLEPTLSSRLENLALSTSNTRRNGAPYRHVLLHGPPGTGKTLFAKKLARASGMDYAIMTGGDVSPLGRDAVTEIHRLFDWSATSSRGLLIFVDEADAFLRKRSNATMSEDLRNALNAFLYRTGTETRDYMLVLASNLPEQLDFAILDRADEAVEFTLPGPEERAKMLKLYFDKYLVNPVAPKGFLRRATAKITLAPEVDEAKLANVVRMTEGFSGREMAKLVVAFQAAAFGTPDATLTALLVDGVVEAHVEAHVEKRAWSRSHLAKTE
jgi:ATPase family AAA domain-containing protein 3A/B